jgi:hypothetical protein
MTKCDSIKLLFDKEINYYSHTKYQQQDNYPLYFHFNIIFLKDTFQFKCLFTNYSPVGLLKCATFNNRIVLKK